MDLQSKRVLLTGASGGIGAPLARELAQRGADLMLVGRRESAIRATVKGIGKSRHEVRTIIADLTLAADRDRLAREVRGFGGIDVLINNAGAMEFTEFAGQTDASVQRLVDVNVLAPLLLTRAVLPDMLERGEGRIVNIGSVLGSIGFGYYAVYSATKAALRGFSEALRREVADRGVGVTYIAPRAVKTPLNPPEVYRMAEAIDMHMDDPAAVARRIVRAIERERDEVYLGFPESFFVRLNALLPRVVDRALRKQFQTMRGFLRPGETA